MKKNKDDEYKPDKNSTSKVISPLTLGKDEDCPSELIELFDASKSEWRKAIIKQFIELHEWRQDVTRKLTKINRYEKLILAVLTIIGTTYVSQVIVPRLL